ncbi:hypothetical protein ASZ90_016160 [hydrocarbon metagenome]|uniref:Uncharacterized protein n=1 Tax=hydrocarbon metagenome TaxID=938273 RepID=A0A0W8EZZ5_9ZZZZ
MSAWVDDDGSPKRQVRRFQVIALSSAARRTGRRSREGSIASRPERVNATALPPMRAPSRTSAATKMIPCRGVADREAMNVAAMELASWNPFVKVNAKARRITMTAMVSMARAYLSFSSSLIVVGLGQRKGCQADERGYPRCRSVSNQGDKLHKP